MGCTRRDLRTHNMGAGRRTLAHVRREPTHLQPCLLVARGSRLCVASQAFVVLWIEQGGLMLAVEHRYFGESLPFGKNSYKPENLKYLTIENALAGAVARHPRFSACDVATAHTFTFCSQTASRSWSMCWSKHPTALTRSWHLEVLVRGCSCYA